MKRRTLDHQAKLNQETARIKTRAESDGRIKQERDNKDITLEINDSKYSADRKVFFVFF